MLFKLFLAFTLVPVIEIYLLIKVGGHIGALRTVLLVIATGFAGAYLARLQGMQTMLSSVWTARDAPRVIHAAGNRYMTKVLDDTRLLVATDANTVIWEIGFTVGIGAIFMVLEGLSLRTLVQSSTSQVGRAQG